MCAGGVKTLKRRREAAADSQSLSPIMLKLQVVLLLMVPFGLVALYHHLSYATSRPHSLAGRPHAAGPPKIGLHSASSTGMEQQLKEGSKMADGAAQTDGETADDDPPDKPDADETDSESSRAPDEEEEEEEEEDLEQPAASQSEQNDPKPMEPKAKQAQHSAAKVEQVQQSAAEVSTAASIAATTASATAGDDVAVAYPDPTLSSNRLLDGSENYLPVPDAEGDSPSDLRWRAAIPDTCKPPAGAATAPLESAAPVLPSGCVCPPGRRPFHTILTAQASTYQRWQTLIFYHHFRKQQRLQPCTEMVGFTRLLASANGGPDDLMKLMPTVTVAQLGFDKTRGFQVRVLAPRRAPRRAPRAPPSHAACGPLARQVINRPWTMLQFIGMPEFQQRITEAYVYIAETDHLLLHDLPNRATPKLNVAFFFPYMSPVPTEQANVVKRYYDGNHLSVQPVGPSPAIVHVDNLKKLTPLWYQLSVDLKHDSAADRAFGWVLEMWGYSIACARVGVKHYVWQQFQIEPSSTWHQNVSAENPFIYHYTFGVEYSSDGIPMVGTVGEWSLDKRHYFGAPPPRKLDEPPACAQECAWTWWRLFNEATAALGDLYPANTGGNLRSFKQSSAAADADASALGRAITRTGPWVIDGKKKPILFHTHGRVSGMLGQGSWSVTGELTVTLNLCGSSTLTFDSSEKPSKFTISSAGGLSSRLMRGSLGSAGAVDDLFSTSRSAKWQPGDEQHAGVRRLLGTGPSAWAGISTMAFLDHGVLVTPWGHGTYSPDREAADVVLLEFAGAIHRVTTFDCHKFTSVRMSDSNRVDGWIQLGGGRPGPGCGSSW